MSGLRGSVSTLVLADVALGLAAGVLIASDRPVLGLLAGTVALGAALVTARFLVGWLGRDHMSGWERLRLEIERARRHNTSLVVARFPLASAAVTDSSVRGLVGRTSTSLRGVDHAWVEGQSLYVLLSGADRQTAQPGVRRVAAEADGLLAGTPVLAALPDDVLTMGAMVDQLHPANRPQPVLGRVPQQAVPRLESLRVEAEGQATA